MDTLLVAIIPPEPAHTQLLGEMRTWCTRLGSEKPLQFPPHITLANRFQTQNAPLCIDALQSALASVPAFDVRIGNLESFSPPHILFRSVELTEGLRALHERTLDIVATYKTPWIRPDFAALTLDDKQREYLERYGSPFVRRYYHPHLTLAGPDVQYHDFLAVRAAMPSVTTLVTHIDRVHILQQVPQGWRVLTHVPLRP